MIELLKKAIDNPQKAWLDIGETAEEIFEFRAIGGEMKYYVIAGNNFDDIQKSFTELVGRQPLPPRWALGNLQSRMAYRTQSQLEVFPIDFFPIGMLIGFDSVAAQHSGDLICFFVF